jgi:TATA element modulatory factor
MRDLQTELLKSQSQVQSLQDSITSLETRLTEQAAAFTKEKESLQESFETSLDTRLKEEKQKWEEDQQILFAAPPLSAGYPQFPTPMSPRQPQRAFKSVSPQPEIATKPRGTFPPSRTTSYGDIPHLRRPSRPFASPFDVLSPASTPSIHIPHHTLEDEDERDFLSPSRGDSPKNTVADAVSVSASTTTAGPSVNIMERMSAAVRRLESDLAATKEEMARSIKQRDEAREECVKLMSEVEEKRRFQQAVRDTKTKYDDLENRFVSNGSRLIVGIMRRCYCWERNQSGWRSYRWIL